MLARIASVLTVLAGFELACTGRPLGDGGEGAAMEDMILPRRRLVGVLFLPGGGCWSTNGRGGGGYGGGGRGRRGVGVMGVGLPVSAFVGVDVDCSPPVAKGTC